LTRSRETLVQQRTDEVNRLQQTLEGANIKLAAVASDGLGVSGREMLAALLGGKADPALLAELAGGRLRAQLPALRQALTGRVQAHHRVLLAQLLAHIDFLEESLAHLQEEIEHALAPFTAATELLQTIPGVGAVVAAPVAEIGTDPARFPSAKHLASWAGGCPGNTQRAGKRLSGKTTQGNVWLRGMLTEAAWAVARPPGTSLHAHDRRIARRHGKYTAAMAAAHRLLVIAYRLLRDQAPYRDLGPTYLDERDAARAERYHVRRLEQLGYSVTLSPAA
jgi:transposase